jgi:hypothetical protein
LDERADAMPAINFKKEQNSGGCDIMEPSAAEKEGYLAVEEAGMPASPPGSPCSSKGSNDSLISSKTNTPTVVFRCRASYHRWMIALLSIAPLAAIISMIIVYHDKKVTSEMTSSAIVCLFGIALGIIAVYSFILPKRYEVLSDSSINVVTFYYTWNFDNVTTAFKDPPFEELHQGEPKFKFSTNWMKRVLVKRRDSLWDVLISPKDTKGFVTSVCKIAADSEGYVEER